MDIRELIHIILTTLYVSGMATIIATLFGVPLGIWIGFSRGKHIEIIKDVVTTFTALPPVLAGLFIYLIAVQDIFVYDILYTPFAIILAQILIVTPVITADIFPVVEEYKEDFLETCNGLRLKKSKIYFLLLNYLKSTLTLAFIIGFNRALAEASAAMIVGGNIQYYTRTLTTSIMLYTNQGNINAAIALGIVLLVISFTINMLVQRFKRKIK